MNLFAESTEGSFRRVRQVLPERPCRIWITLDNGQALHANFQHLLPSYPSLAKSGWEGWQTVQSSREGRRLTWGSELSIDLDTLHAEALIGCRRSPIQATYLASAAAFYRPLYDWVSPQASDSPSAALVRHLYGAEPDAFLALVRHYPAPAALVYRRLLDLILAIQQAFSMSETNVRNLLHWRWQASHRQLGGIWPTPFNAIQHGALHYVEATLYPYPAGGGWS